METKKIKILFLILFIVLVIIPEIAIFFNIRFCENVYSMDKYIGGLTAIKFYSNANEIRGVQFLLQTFYLFMTPLIGLYEFKLGKEYYLSTSRVEKETSSVYIKIILGCSFPYLIYILLSLLDLELSNDKTIFISTRILFGDGFIINLIRFILYTIIYLSNLFSIVYFYKLINFKK
ncbi:hypothetical protein ACUHGC_06555 [Testudinibacter sp. P27/CKL/0425]